MVVGGLRDGACLEPGRGALGRQSAEDRPLEGVGGRGAVCGLAQADFRMASLELGFAPVGVRFSGRG